jgi:hypothetical protein
MNKKNDNDDDDAIFQFLFGFFCICFLNLCYARLASPRPHCPRMRNLLFRPEREQQHHDDNDEDDDGHRQR